MKNATFITIGFFCLAASPVAVQAQIHKCLTAEGIVYQGRPCAESEREVLLATPGKKVRTEQTYVKASLPESGPGPALPPVGSSPSPPNFALSVLPAAGTPLSVGMSDLEVLNLRGWGRPSKITRSKANGVWREDWLYAPRGDGAKQLLQFANAKLAAIQTEPAVPAPQQVILLTQQ